MFFLLVYIDVLFYFVFALFLGICMYNSILEKLLRVYTVQANVCYLSEQLMDVNAYATFAKLYNNNTHKHIYIHIYSNSSYTFFNLLIKKYTLSLKKIPRLIIRTERSEKLFPLQYICFVSIRFCS